MGISLTELRQRLFQLADRVVDTGEPLVVMRRGVRLRLIRDDAAPVAVGRLARLKAHKLVIGDPLAPYESPAAWSELPHLRVAEPTAEWPGVPAKKTRRKT